MSYCGKIDWSMNRVAIKTDTSRSLIGILTSTQGLLEYLAARCHEESVSLLMGWQKVCGT